MTKQSNKLATVARIALGLIFVVSGLNGFFHFMPNPPLDGRAAAFMQALEGSGYFLPLLKSVELMAGLLLLAGRMIPLALTALATVVVNILAFHVFLAPAGLPVVAVMLASGSYLAWRHRDAFRPLLRARTAARGWAAERVLGAVFLASGLAGILDRTPPPSTAGAAALMAGFRVAGYLLPFVSAVQVAAGALLLARRFVPLALVVLAPVVAQIAAYRLWVHTPGMMVVTAAIVGLHGGLVWAHRQSFAGLFGSARAKQYVVASTRHAGQDLANWEGNQ